MHKNVIHELGSFLLNWPKQEMSDFQASFPLKFLNMIDTTLNNTSNATLSLFDHISLLNYIFFLRILPCETEYVS